MLVQFLFYAFSAVLIASAFGVITARNPVHSALCLVLCFFTSAALWLLIEAEFLAIVLVLVYVGAVMVLFLFVVMMLDINVEEVRKGLHALRLAGLADGSGDHRGDPGRGRSASPGYRCDTGPAPQAADYSNTSELGQVLYTKYVYPFELAAVLLLVAIVAAIVLTMRHRKGLKVQDVGKQVATRAKDRVRVLKIQPEKRE